MQRMGGPSDLGSVMRGTDMSGHALTVLALQMGRGVLTWSMFEAVWVVSYAN